jgi:hypothetical protein
MSNPRCLARHSFSSILMLLACSCNSEVREPNRSLVGAKLLPSDPTLAQETLIVTDDSKKSETVQYELRHDGLLSIVRHRSDPYGNLKPDGETQVRVSPRVAAEVRRLLRRVRPEQLEGITQNVPPEGCRRQDLHPTGEFSVAFVDPGPSLATTDDRIGVFLLGHVTACQSAACCTAPAAFEARRVVRAALEILNRTGADE